MTKKSNKFPVAKRPGEYIAFTIIQIPTNQGTGYVYTAVDYYSQFAFNLGVDNNDNPETILKYVYQLTENADFRLHIDKGFTLVIKEYEALADQIKAIIHGVCGKLLVDKALNNHITSPFIRNLKAL